MKTLKNSLFISFIFSFFIAANSAAQNKSDVSVFLGKSDKFTLNTVNERTMISFNKTKTNQKDESRLLSQDSENSLRFVSIKKPKLLKSIDELSMRTMEELINNSDAVWINYPYKMNFVIQKSSSCFYIYEVYPIFIE